MFTIIQYASLIMFPKSYSTKHYSFLRRYRDISERHYGQIYLGNKCKVKNGIKTLVKIYLTLNSQPIFKNLYS